MEDLTMNKEIQQCKFTNTFKEAAVTSKDSFWCKSRRMLIHKQNNKNANEVHIKYSTKAEFQSKKMKGAMIKKS